MRRTAEEACKQYQKTAVQWSCSVALHRRLKTCDYRHIRAHSVATPTLSIPIHPTDMRIVFLLAFLLLATRATAQLDVPEVTYPRLTRQATSAAGFVPAGWTLEKNLRGDLNGDGAADLAMVLRQTDRRNVVSNTEGLGVESLNTNPRILAVAFASKSSGGYTLAVENHRLIPRHDSPTLDDPFQDMVIVKGTLQVSLLQFASAGSWGTSTTKFTFRNKGNCFQLIGYDRNELHRGSGETTDLSINFLTKKATVSTGNIESDRKKVKAKKVRTRPAICIDMIGDGWEFDPEVV